MTMIRHEMAMVALGFCFAGICTFSSPALAAEGTLGPWRKDDFIYTDQLVDDRPNEASRAIVKEHFIALVPERFFLGENKKLGFRIAPRNERWAGILITTPDGAPMKLPKPRSMGPYKVEVLNAVTSEKVKDMREWHASRIRGFIVLDTKVMFSDASRIYPKTEIRVFKNKELLDRVAINFSEWNLPRSKIQMRELVPSIVDKGFVRPKGVDFVRDDGKRMFFWGGHENHIPPKEQADLYAEAYREAGINVMRHIGMREMLDQKTGKIKPQMLDRYHYLIAKLGQNGIYFFMSSSGGKFTDREWRERTKRFWKEMLTAVNPYTGKALKDDPTLIGFELANETGLNPRRFDYNRLDQPEDMKLWQRIFGDFLLKKYGSREALAEAWAVDPLFKWEDPAKHTIMVPTRFRGQRSHGGTGQHDNYTTGRYYLDGVARIASPRISDMIECTYEVQREWATDLMRFLKNEVGLKCAIGWNGDGFHICQVPNHKANMDSPGTVTISSGYCDWDNGNQLTSRTKNLKRFTTFGYIYNRPTFAYEWGGWATMGPYQHEYILLAALMGRVYGFDGFAHHKMAACIYPVADPWYSLKVHYITPLTDRRRGGFYVARWILERSRIEERRDKIIIGYPDGSAFCGGPDRKMSSPGFENWVMYQLPTEDYSFKEVYDGPTDRIVIHEGRAPAGDYRKAKHAVLWSHSNTGPDGKDPKAKEKWFALHGVKFKPGQKYYLDDHYFATTEDMTEYVVTHRKAEEARWGKLRKIKRPGRNRIEVEDDYWAAEPDAEPTELDRQLYRAFKRWGYDVPFAEEEIDKVWRGPGMSMDTTKVKFVADRDDMQLWFGKMAGKGGLKLSRLEVRSDEKQFAIALLPWDTADFKTAKTLAVWSIWNGDVTVKHPFPEVPKIYAVNWLGVRIFEVQSKAVSKDSITFPVARHDDVFCYEIVRFWRNEK